MDRIILSVDGNCGCALLGENLHEGEAEFVEVSIGKEEHLHTAEIKACWKAFHKLINRLNIPRDTISYAWYPRKPGSSGA